MSCRVDIKRFAYQFRDEGDGFSPGSNIRHAVDVAVERIVSRVSETHYKTGLLAVFHSDGATNNCFAKKVKREKQKKKNVVFRRYCLEYFKRRPKDRLRRAGPSTPVVRVSRRIFNENAIYALLLPFCFR